MIHMSCGGRDDIGLKIISQALRRNVLRIELYSCIIESPIIKDSRVLLGRRGTDA
jgi:hypothetical protein